MRTDFQKLRSNLCRRRCACVCVLRMQQCSPQVRPIRAFGMRAISAISPISQLQPRAAPCHGWRGIARRALKSGNGNERPCFRLSIETRCLYAGPKGRLRRRSDRFYRKPCGVPPAVPWVPPSAGAEKWEKWRKWLACQKYESDGPADCTVAFARRRRRRNDDDKGSISTFENQFSTRAPHNL